MRNSHFLLLALSRRRRRRRRRALVTCELFQAPSSKKDSRGAFYCCFWA